MSFDDWPAPEPPKRSDVMPFRAAVDGPGRQESIIDFKSSFVRLPRFMLCLSLVC